MKQVKKLDLEALALTDLELTVLLAEMASLENLNLRVMPQDIVRFNLPVNYFEGDIPEEDAKVMQGQISVSVWFSLSVYIYLVPVSLSLSLYYCLLSCVQRHSKRQAT